MAPRKFDRYMVHVAMGSHPKLGGLSDSEYRAHISGVLAVAAVAPIRGCLLVGELDAEPVHIAKAAGVTVRVARVTMEKLEALGILYRDGELGCLRVHDWDDLNPEPRKDDTNVDRQRRFRERRRNARNGTNNAGSNTTSNAGVTQTEARACGASPSSSSSLSSSGNDQGDSNPARKPGKSLDQTEPPPDLPADLLPRLREVLAILHGIWEARGGAIMPQERGAGLGMLRNIHADHVGVARSLQHWLLAGKGQRAATTDVAKRFGDWCADAPAGAPSRPVNGRSNGRRENASDLLRAINGGAA